MNVLRLYMRMRRALRNSTKSGVFIDMSLCKHATKRPSRVIAATTAMHLKPIFYLSIFNEASPAFAQYLALIQPLVKHASSTKTMFARDSINLITLGSTSSLLLFIDLICVSLSCQLNRITRCLTRLTLYTFLSLQIDSLRPGKRIANKRVRCNREKVLQELNTESLQR